MSVYAIADLHLSFSVNKPMDVFKGWENYTDRLKQNWQRLITPEDTVVIAGDVSWAMNLSQIYEDFKFIDGLNGKKIILKGNPAPRRQGVYPRQPRLLVDDQGENG